MDTLELHPFRELMREGLGSVMVAHLHIPSYDARSNVASTLSPEVVDKVLRQQMGFEGLAFTDALNMKGVSKFWKPGELEVNALLAGNDVLLFPENVPVAIEAIKKAIADSILTEAIITERCHRILKTKEWTGALNRKPIDKKNLTADLNDWEATRLKQRLAEASLTVIRNEGVLPLADFADKRIAVLNVGPKGSGKAFNEVFAKYFAFDAHEMDNSPDFEASKQVVDQLAAYDLVVMNLLGTNNSVKKNYGVTNVSIRVANTISSKTKLVLNVFATPYSLRKMTGVEQSQAITIAYHDDEVTQRAMAEAVVGAIGFSGRLPVEIGTRWKAGHGIEVNGPTRIRYASPEIVGLSAKSFAKIDSIAKMGIREKAYPGCQIAIIMDGVLVYDKAFGHLTYDKEIPVTTNTVYDLASITKIASSTALMMHFHEKGVVNVDFNLCDYLDICDTLDYFQMNIREMMSHYAKLKDWIPFYIQTLEKGNHKPDVYSNEPRAGYSTLVAPGLFVKDNYRQKMLDQILATQLREKLEYKYSDLGYYFIQEILRNKTGRDLDKLADSLFYRPLGLKRTGYNPLSMGIPLSEIAPTELDKTFRKQLVHGHVHDQGAAMLGGVAGHAGLFSTAGELAVLMQMMANGGVYGGKRYLSEDVLEYFITCHYCDGNNRRGIGFDKPAQVKNGGSTCNSASWNSYGHTGFTGTIAWADPEHNIVFVFLSNRVYPDAENKKILSLNIRPEIQQAIYDLRKIPSRFDPKK
jgi:beta-N-acetylhexosaminidase